MSDVHAKNKYLFWGDVLILKMQQHIYYYTDPIL
jgi:hypothetical protein